MITVSQMSPIYTSVGIHMLLEEKNHHQIDLKGGKIMNTLLMFYVSMTVYNSAKNRFFLNKS